MARKKQRAPQSAGNSPSAIEHRLIGAIPFAKGFSDDVLAAIGSCAVRHDFARGDVLFNSGQPSTAALVVIRGVLKTYIVSASGRTKTLALLIEGDTWSEDALVDVGLHDCTCQALEDGAVLRLERHAVEEVVKRNGEVALAFLRAAAARIRRSRDEIQALSFRAADSRIARTLIDLATRRGRAGLDGIVIDLPLSHQEIADLIGVRREAVTRGLLRFKQAGILDTQGRKILLREMASLEDLALG